MFLALKTLIWTIKTTVFAGFGDSGRLDWPRGQFLGPRKVIFDVSDKFYFFELDISLADFFVFVRKSCHTDKSVSFRFT